MNSIYYSMHLDKTRTNLPGADLDRAATPQGCAPGTAHIKNLAANPGRSPLMRSYGYASAGDRPALIARIPVAHIHGGETTEGAIDEAIRHSITKIAYLHFTGAEDYRRTQRGRGCLQW